MLLLYQQPDLATPFPKALFKTDADWQAFIALVQQNVPEKPTEQSDTWRLIAAAIIGVLVFLAILGSIIMSTRQ